MKLFMLWRIVYNKEDPVAVKNGEMRKHHAPCYITLYSHVNIIKTTLAYVNTLQKVNINRETSPQFGGHNRGSPYRLEPMILSPMFVRPSPTSPYCIR